MRLEVFMGPCQRCGRCFTPPTPLDRMMRTGFRHRRRRAGVNTAGAQRRADPDALSMVVVITSVVAVEMRRLRFAAMAYSAQALLIVGLLAELRGGQPVAVLVGGDGAGHQGDPDAVVPVPLHRHEARTASCQPLIGFGPSVVVAALLMIGFYRLTHGHVALLAPDRRWRSRRCSAPTWRWPRRCSRSGSTAC